MTTFNIHEATPTHLALAKRHGKRVEGRDGDCVVVAYHWQGDIYITEVIGPEPPPPKGGAPE